MTLLNRLTGLILVTICTCNAQAGMLEETCSEIFEKLSSGSYDSLMKSGRSFTDSDKQYQGCVIRLTGNLNELTDAQFPDGLFGRSLPHCPNGSFPTDLPRIAVNEDGWCTDRMADGPDGTSYRTFRENVFCVVEGHWDGGDDSDPGYVPSPGYELIVKCANR